MKYNVGDKVRIVSKWGPKNASINHSSKMDKWLGKVMTIRRVGMIDYNMEEDHSENDGSGWYWSDDEIAGLATECSQKIVITSDGKETLARLYEGKKVVKSATAKCSAGDTFDFSVGAKLAYVRLMEKYKSGDKVKVINNTCHHYAKIGDVITLTNEYGNDCLGRKSWHYKEGAGYIIEEDFELAETSNDKKTKAKKAKKEKFVPHIEDKSTHYGNLGDPTNYKDAIGRPLVVGDTVELFDENNRSYGETPIVKAAFEWNGNKAEAFVMGIQISCDDKKGTTGEWKIIKKRSFEDVKDGEVVEHGLKYIKTEP